MGYLPIFIVKDNGMPGSCLQSGYRRANSLVYRRCVYLIEKDREQTGFAQEDSDHSLIVFAASSLRYHFLNVFISMLCNIIVD